MNVAGIDVGLSRVRPSSGFCRTGFAGEVFKHTTIDRLTRVAVSESPVTYDVVAIDAPVLSAVRFNREVRPCEKVFVWGAFQKRCKPGESHISGTGFALRMAGAETARIVLERVEPWEGDKPFPRVFGNRNIVEAFPNAFLGVCLERNSIPPNVKRGKKFDVLYDKWLREGVPARLQAALSWPRDEFWRAVESNNQHDERAAIVCALTALCVLRGSFVAVGEPEGGYFFLPPWNFWTSWARDALSVNRTDSRLITPVEVWIDGECYEAEDDLPLVLAD